MKTHFIILTIIFVAFLFGGCKSGENFDFKASIIPQAGNSSISINDMNKSGEVINKRLLYLFKIPQENIKLGIDETHILLTIHNIDTNKIGIITNAITSNKKLEFWETYNNSEIIGSLTKADNLLQAMLTNGTTHIDEKQQNPKLTVKSNLKTAEPDSRKQFSDQNPLFSILGPMVTTTGEPLPSCMIGLADAKDTASVDRYFQMDTIKALFPAHLKLFWSSKPYKYDPSKTLYGLHAIKVTTPDRSAPLDGNAIISAEVSTGTNKKEIKIGLTMNPEGSKAWAKITRENISRCIAVVYDGSVRSYPKVMGEISGGKTEITGDFTKEEANELVSLLKSGELPFEIKVIDKQIIKGPK